MWLSFENRQDYNTRHGCALLSVSVKVFAHLLLMQVHDQVLRLIEKSPNGLLSAQCYGFI